MPASFEEELHRRTPRRPILRISQNGDSPHPGRTGADSQPHIPEQLEDYIRCNASAALQRTDARFGEPVGISRLAGLGARFVEGRPQAFCGKSSEAAIFVSQGRSASYRTLSMLPHEIPIHTLAVKQQLGAIAHLLPASRPYPP